MDTKTDNSKYFARNPFVFLIFFLLISAVYSNSLNSSWHFDDNANILDNKNIHLENLNIGSIIKSCYHWDNHNIYRPITNLSFALNWFVGKDIVTGYHLANIFIHILTTIFLYLVILKILDTRRLKHIYAKNAQSIAIIATSLWAVHPIHVQAITFIVQRATSLSALFSIISLYTYILARENDDPRKSNIFYIFCFISFLLAIGSKENALLIPVALTLIEIIFLHQIPLQTRWNNRTFWLSAVAVILISLFCIFCVVFPGGFSLNILDYSERTFTLAERILTEPRVLIFYLSQIAYPLSSRFSLEHDISLSTSPLYPWTTLPAIVLILVASVISILKYKKYPLFAFAVLFYFCNHLIESTILHLEIIFEHRNYLPSFFLFCLLSL